MSNKILSEICCVNKIQIIKRIKKKKKIATQIPTLFASLNYSLNIYITSYLFICIYQQIIFMRDVFLFPV